jgi:threonine dehydrogenase-like Zn-dependent dehydrogenase
MLDLAEVRAAVARVATGLRARPNRDAPFLESDLRNGLVKVLQGTPEKRLRIKGWSATLGGVDVFIEAVGPQRGTGIETKVWSIDQVLYDMLKLAAMCHQRDLGIGYVVVAARDRDWTADATRGGLISLMSETGPEPSTWLTAAAIETEGARWSKMVQKTNVKPVWVPAHLETAAAAAVRLPFVHDHQIRIVRVRPVGQQKLRLDEHGAVISS